MYYLQSRYYDPEVGRFLNADTLVSTGQGILGNNMFAYCRNNPVCRIDIVGTRDYSKIDDEPLTEEDIVNIREGGGCSNSGVPGPATNQGGPSSGYPNYSGYGLAPKQGIPGSTYTQFSSDGANTVVSQTTYGEYGAPSQRIDYQGRDHGVGLPHVHELSWGIREGKVVPQGERIYRYRM